MQDNKYLTLLSLRLINLTAYEMAPVYLSEKEGWRDGRIQTNKTLEKNK